MVAGFVASVFSDKIPISLTALVLVLGVLFTIGSVLEYKEG
ncbi:hypothetical protein SPONN_1419 [uncultured Candidatus Thioglobus sp.]|nr:hypothetical protein SPONN_1419 [uncultured Candidatus Thioglobus sp.]SMN01243.1 hypothetical protein SPONL_1878 [uncultured Candidatus Thioglobus sp.]